MNLSILDGRAELWQWDTGVRLVMDEACETVNISASTFGVSVDVTAAEDGKTWVAAVPDEMLQVPGDLICYAVQTTGTGTITAAYRSFRVNRRPKPYGYVATPTEARTWQQLYDFIEQGGGSVQPDWAQNDAAAADYVRNRPGGYITTQDSIIALDSYDHKGIYIPAINPNEPFIVQVDGSPKTINFAFVVETNYRYTDETSEMEYSLYTDNASYGYMFLSIETGEGKHSIKIAECIPHKFQDIFMPQSATQNIHFIKGGNDTFTEDELKSLVGMQSLIQVTKKYEGDRNWVYANLNGNLFVPGRFITTSFKQISIDSSLETQTIDDFIDKYGWIQLGIYDTNSYDTYTAMIYIVGGDANIGGKSYYNCAQTVAYINGHLFAIFAYRYSIQNKKLHSTLTIKRIL